MKQKFFVLLILLFFSLNVLNAKQNFTSITLSPNSNIYIKTMLFYLPITNKISHSYHYFDATSSFDSIFSIDKSNVPDKPVVRQIFTSDISIRVSGIPTECPKTKYITLPVTIRLNKTVIERTATFKVKTNKNKISAVGYIKKIKIQDLTNNDSFQKRKDWKMPLIIDLQYFIK